MKLNLRRIIDGTNYLITNYDEAELAECGESYEFDPTAITESWVAALDEETVDDLFSSLIETFMDVSGEDNYGEVLDLLNEITPGIDSNKFESLID